MLLIHKGKEPAALTEYRAGKWNPVEKQSLQPTYDDLPTEIKDRIRKKLLIEQGFLCAYCMRRMSSIDDVKIEHWKPEAELDEDGKLEYGNMLGVCYGRIKSMEGYAGRKYETCDQHRGSIPLTVDPRIPEIISRIEYSSKNGRITSKDPAIEHDLTDTLNLNCGAPHFLPENRKEVLNSAIQMLNRKAGKTGQWKRSDMLKVRRIFETRNEKGELQEYSGIVLWYINSRLARDKRNG